MIGSDARVYFKALTLFFWFDGARANVGDVSKVD